MPLYEYQCDGCGHRFEIIQKFSDPPLQSCPKCGGSVHKLQSAPAFHLKGSGWYITDYAKKDQSPARPDGASADGGGDKSEKQAGGTDKKEATASEKKDAAGD